MATETQLTHKILHISVFCRSTPALQQSGLGSLLMDAAEDYCRELGASFMNIKVVHLRTELLPYYRKRGYVETGTSPFPAEVETKVSCHFIDMSKPLGEQ